jgi:hypothetical protein
MKESERLRLEMEDDDSDNDYRFANWLRKIERAKRFEKFIESYLPILRIKFDVRETLSCGYLINQETNPFTYYPKADSIEFHNSGKWFRYGEKYILKIIHSEDFVKPTSSVKNFIEQFASITIKKIGEHEIFNIIKSWQNDKLISRKQAYDLRQSIRRLI